MKVTNEMVRGGMEALNAVTGKAMPAADRARCVLEAALHDVPEPWAEVVVDRPSAPLVLAPAEPQADAPTDITRLPNYWDERRAKQQKPDKSRCAAELRIALAMLVGDKPNEPYKQGFSDGFARGVEYGRALAQLEKP